MLGGSRYIPTPLVPREKHIYNPDVECREDYVPPEKSKQPQGRRCQIKPGNQYGIAAGHYVIRNNALYDLNGNLISSNQNVIRYCLNN